MYNPYFGGMPQSNYPQNFNSGFHMNSGPPAPPGMGYGGYGAFGQSAYNNYTGYGGMGTTCAPPFTGFQAVQSTHNSYPMGNIPPPPPQPMPQSYQDQGLLNRMASMELQMQQQAYQNMGYKPPPSFPAPHPQSRHPSYLPQYTGPTAPYEGEEQQKQQLSEEEESKPEIDDQVKQKMRQTFIAELQRRYAINGTFELAQGTVVPLLYYPEDDIVVEFYRKERDEDLAKKPWDPEADCEYLRKAMKGAGTTESIITHIVATRCNSQRQELKKQFKTMYGRDLIEDIKSELSGDYKDAILACFVSPAYFDAKCIKKAIYGLGTDEQALIEILMTRTNAQIQEIRDVYGSVARPKNVTKDTLIDQDIRDDTSGDFRKLLVAACQGNRYTIKPEKLDEAVEEILNANQEGTGMFQVNYAKLTDEAKAKREAMRLYKAGEDRWGTDEEQFILIFSTRDFYQLREIFQQYIKITQANVLNAIDEETSGSFKKGLAAISMSVMNRPKYFARKLIKSMKGLGTDEETLIRIVASRSEIDMVQIKAAFLEETNKTLYRYIAEDTSFNFKKILQALVKEG